MTDVLIEERGTREKVRMQGPGMAHRDMWEEQRRCDGGRGWRVVGTPRGQEAEGDPAGP